MNPLTIVSMQYPVDSLFGSASSSVSITSSGDKIFDLITDQYLSQAQLVDTSGLYSQMSASTMSQQSPMDILSAIGTSGDTVDYGTQLAVYHATITNPMTIFGEGNSLGDMLDMYA